MKYYSKYLLDLCVPWSDESELLFERSAICFCELANTWNRKSATFIEHQRFRFLSNFVGQNRNLKGIRQLDTRQDIHKIPERRLRVARLEKGTWQVGVSRRKRGRE